MELTMTGNRYHQDLAVLAAYKQIMEQLARLGRNACGSDLVAAVKPNVRLGADPPGGRQDSATG